MVHFDKLNCDLHCIITISASMLQSGKTNLGHELHKVLTAKSSSGEDMLKYLNLKSKNLVLETVNRLEAAIFSWKERISEQVSGKSPVRSSWSPFVKDPMSEVDKLELLLDRAETLLQLIKIRYPNLPQTFLDATKVQYGKVSFIVMYFTNYSDWRRHTNGLSDSLFSFWF